MDDYIFFDTNLRDRFVEYAKKLGVPCELRDDTMGLIVAVPEDLDQDLVDGLEDRYEELEEEQSELLALSEGGLRKLAGFQLVLPDGQNCTVPLQADVARRLLSCFSFDEVQALFDAVARSVLNPKDVPLCEILHAEKPAVGK